MIPAFVSFLNPDNAESWTSTRIVLLGIKHYNNLLHPNMVTVSYSREGRGGGDIPTPLPLDFRPNVFNMQHLSYKPSGAIEETSQSLNLNIFWGTIHPPPWFL